MVVGGCMNENDFDCKQVMNENDFDCEHYFRLEPGTVVGATMCRNFKCEWCLGDLNCIKFPLVCFLIMCRNHSSLLSPPF